MKRFQVLLLITHAGYHGDRAGAQRLYITNRVSREAHTWAWDRGIRARTAGLRCDCSECVSQLRGAA